MQFKVFKFLKFQCCKIVFRAGCPVKKAEMEYFRILEQVKEERKQFLMENILDKDKIF